MQYFEVARLLISLSGQHVLSNKWFKILDYYYYFFFSGRVNDLCLCEETHTLSGFVLARFASDVSMAKFPPVDGTLIPGFNPNL